jgi:uncharacterized protein YeaO (DUF488 family)
MLKQASVGQIRNGEVSRDDGYIVLAMCFFPRGFKRELRDEYLHDLAPDRVLFKEWLAYSREFGHEEAFKKSDYENRFQLNGKARYDLRRLTEKVGDVYLVCQCAVGERCHREMLMLAAKTLYGGNIDKVFNEYPEFLARVGRP